MIKIKRYITCILIFAMVLTSAVTMTVGEVDAAAKGTKEAMIDQMKAYSGKTLAETKKAMKKKGYAVWEYNYDWCAWYVTQCARNVGLSNKIPRETWACDLPANIINAGGEVYFCSKKAKNIALASVHCKGTKSEHVNTEWKGATKKYVEPKNFSPQRGDLVFYDWEPNNTINHVEIITKVDSKYIYSIGANRGTTNWSKSRVDTKERKYRKDSGFICAYARPNYSDKQTFTVKYNANGGKGTMANTTVTIGVQTPLRANAYVRLGYKFAGWTAKRSNNTWLYYNPKDTSKSGWYAEGKQPNAWKKYIYRDKQKVSRTCTKDKDYATFYAQWEKAPVHTFYYDTKGGSVTPPSMQVAESTRFSITQLLPEKEGCMFEGWTVRRTADNKCYVTGKGWLTDAEIKSKGYTKRIYTPGEGYTLDAAWTNGYSGVSNYIFEAQWKRQEELSFTANYDANGGSGTMAYTTIKVGEPTPLRKNQFTRDGYEFVGWTAQKNGLEWVYTNGNGTSGWYEENTQPTGWKKYVYKDQQNIIYNSESMDKCEVTYYAQWKETDEQTFTIKYISNGGNGYMDDTNVIYGNATPLRKNQFTKNDCTFAGWTAMRDNGTWRYISPDGSKDGWYAEGRQPENWEKFVYKDGVNVYYTYDKNKGEVYFVARWEKNTSQEPVEKPDTPEPPVSEPEIIGYVSEAEYNAKYAGNSAYEATPYYRYATRQKEYTKSTASSMAGWTLYNQITTPGSSTWSKTKPTSGTYETGYQYYCWGWEHKGDWTFYYDDNYNDAVAWIKKNYTVWNYNQFRYFWQVYSTNKGSSVKVSQTVNYRDNAGKTGTKAISDTKLWYDGVVYRQKASTKYQYWRWSNWSAWSSWSTQKQTTGDTVKEERQYYVVKK